MRDQSASAEVETRLRALEEAVAGQRGEIRTRRLVVTDERDDERVVAEVVGTTAELRVQLPPPLGGGAPGAAVVAFASPAAPGRPGGTDGDAIGLQVWAAGDALVELEARPGGAGSWGPHLRLSGAS